jgi:hypothetical protein
MKILLEIPYRYIDPAYVREGIEIVISKQELALNIQKATKAKRVLITDS